MSKEAKKADSTNTDYKTDDYEIDKIASLWNQLRLAWIDFQSAKKDGSETKRLEILISNLLKELGIHLDEPQTTEIFQLSIEVIPKPNYGGKSIETHKHI